MTNLKAYFHERYLLEISVGTYIKKGHPQKAGNY